MQADKRIGIDLGGTKIEIVVMDSERRELLRRRVPTPQGDYAATLRAIAELVGFAQNNCGSARSIGIGTPGALSRETELIKNANSTVLNGKPLKRDLERVLGRKVAVSNDANCFALSESADGAARGAAAAFAVILGTGTGGAAIVNGTIVEGANRIAGEWGHNPLPWPRDDERPGPRCYCGKTGCLETFLSGPALARLRQRGGNAAALDLYADRLARGLAGIVNVLDPDVIVLGGGVSNVAELYDMLPHLLRRYVFSDDLRTRIVPAEHGDSSGVRGAAFLVP
ncbi:MAG: ROK family protein [Candidatus Baltobacteraceae bacterium]